MKYAKSGAFSKRNKQMESSPKTRMIFSICPKTFYPHISKWLVQVSQLQTQAHSHTYTDTYMQTYAAQNFAVLTVIHSKLAKSQKKFTLHGICAAFGSSNTFKCVPVLKVKTVAWINWN